MNCFRRKRNETDDNRKYSEAIRTFSLTAFGHSPRCYKYIREKFDNTLPHPRTLTKWYSNSDCNAEPGILHESLQALASKANDLAEEGKPLLASLCFDEMAIRQHIQYDHGQKKWFGYIQYGKTDEDGKVPIAKNILVYMVTFESVSIPIAYYAITSLDACEKKILLIEILTVLHQIGVKVINLTFDGLKSNKAMCELLGASLDPDDPYPFFEHPVDGSLICLMLDNCHMLKLLRNSLGDLKTINDSARGKIEWKYFESLEFLRVNSKFVVTSLTKRHIQFDRNRMNVRLAAQTLSNSVAAAMSHLMESGNAEFKDAKPTIHFVEQVNTLFDIMNTKRIRGNGYDFRSALNPNNADTVFKFFDEVAKYLKSLRFTRKLCIKSRRSTGFIGYLINMTSIRFMYQEYVLSGALTSLPTFYLSQDPLESFFSRLRSLNGNNDNPTVQQVKSSIRKLLFYTEVVSSEFANCVDNLNILSVSSASTSQRHHIDMERCMERDMERDMELIGFEDERSFEESNEYENVAREAIREEECLQNLSCFDSDIASNEDATVAFFAGSLEMRLQDKKFECQRCGSVLAENDKIDGIFFENSKTRKPCKTTYVICKYTHININDQIGSPSFDYKKIVESTLDDLKNVPLFNKSKFDHPDGIFHKLCFVKDIIDEYVRMYCTYKAKCITLEQHQKLMRNKNKRAYIFNGQ